MQNKKIENALFYLFSSALSPSLFILTLYLSNQFLPASLRFSLFPETPIRPLAS